MSFSIHKAGALVLFAGAVLCASVHAQTKSTLPEVVVTATRTPQPITEVVADVSVIERDQIESMGVSSLTELLSRLDGVQTIGFGAASRVYIRGADSYMTALYVDGVKVYSHDGTTVLGGGAPWDMLPLSQIERVELVRGPSSAVYGSDAMGGVVQVFTRRTTDKFAPYVTLGIGSSNLRQVTAGISATTGQVDYALNVGSDSSDGYDTTPQWVHSPDKEPVANRYASARLGFNVVPGQRVELVALNNDQDARYVPWGGGTDYQVKSSLTTGALKWRAVWNAMYNTALSFTQAKQGKRDDYPNDFQTVTQGVLFENEFRMGQGLATVALEHRKDGFDQQANGSLDPAFAGTRSDQAVALGYNRRMGSHAIQINVRNDQDSLFGGHQTGAIAYAYAVQPNLRLTASSGTAFKAPTLEQLYSQYGDVNLKPETNRSNELGLAYSAGANFAKLVVYRNNLSNMISSSQTLTTCASPFGFCYYNVNQATIEGATLSGATRIGGFNLNGSVDVLEPRNDANGKVLSLRARQMAKFNVDTVVTSWTLSAEVVDVGPRFDNASNTVSVGGYDLLNFSASRSLARDWTGLVRVNNLLDKKYQQVDGMAAPGITVFVGVKWAPGS